MKYVEEVQGANEMLGLDPLYIACEGRLVAILGEKDARAILACMQAHPLTSLFQSRNGVDFTQEIGEEREFVHVTQPQLLSRGESPVVRAGPLPR